MRTRRPLSIGVAFLLAFAGAASAQPPFPPGGAMGGPSLPIEKTEAFLLLLNPSVQDDLMLGKDQRALLAKLPEEVRARHKTVLEPLQKEVKDDQEKSAKAAEEFYQKIDAAVARVLKQEQAARLKQIQLQRLGFSAFFDAKVAEALKLTEKQQADLEKVRANFAQEVNDLRTQAKKDGPAKGAFLPIKELGLLDSKAVVKAVAILDDPQTKTWKELTGEPSKLAASSTGVSLTGRAPPESLRRFNDLIVLDHPGLAAELNLDDRQAVDLRAVASDVRTNRPGRIQVGPGGKLPPFLALSQLEAQMAQEARKEALSKILLPLQTKRFDQITLQATGLFAFENVAVLKAVHLTPAQAKAIEDVSNEIGKKRTAPLEGAPADPKAALAMRNKREATLQREAVAATVASFDEAQKKAWAEVMGAPFDLVKADLGPIASRQGPFSGPPPGTPGFAEVSPGRALLGEANSAYFAGQFEKALAAFDECLRLAPDNATACNSKAWLLSTCPEAKYRDGKAAIPLAKKACELTADKNAQHIDTLAAAYAEVGSFDLAIQTMKRAVALGTPQELPDFESHLKSYEENKPVRENPVKGPPSGK